jgi:hypothetical protein
MRLLTSTAAPTNNAKRSPPAARQRFMPRPRISTEMRPSMPARKRWALFERRRSYLHCVNIGMRYSWDERKNRSNIAKHAVAFGDAKRIFEGRLSKKSMTASITAKSESMLSAW